MKAWDCRPQRRQGAPAVLLACPGTGLSYSEKLSGPAPGQAPASSTSGVSWIGWIVVAALVLVMWLLVR